LEEASGGSVTARLLANVTGNSTTRRDEPIVINQCRQDDFEVICTIINDGAEAYRGVIPEDRWHEPYMSQDELCHEIASGVRFWGFRDDVELVGVMGIQDVQDVTLIRHAYVRSQHQGRGIGGKLLAELRKLTSRPILIGTWAAATWAIQFYEKHGFRLVTPDEKNRLLKKYWSIPDRQVETSVVLGDERWFRYRQPLVRHREETVPMDCPYGHVQRIVTGGEGGVANVHVVRVTKGTTHAHTGYDEAYYVLSGTGHITLGDDVHPLRPSSVAIIPAGVPHSLEADPGEELEFVIFGTPPMPMDDERAKPKKA
jgi:mannose-6-phosphate isomerase-like protein (cupin superfamily)/GNAT superfamily N-acetyltransferase